MKFIICKQLFCVTEGTTLSTPSYVMAQWMNLNWNNSFVHKFGCDYLNHILSLSTVVLNSMKNYGFRNFRTFKNNLTTGFSRKTYLDALVLLYLGCIFVKRSEKSNISIHSEF